MSNIDKQALRDRYSEKPAPKCHICGSVMTIQRAGAGGVVYGCTGRIDKDGEGYKFTKGRDFADDHYARSRVTVTDESDPDVLALLDELEASQSENERLAKALIERNGEPVEGLVKRVAELEEIATDYGMKFQRAQDALKHQSLLHKTQMEAAEKRVADLEAREVKPVAWMRNANVTSFMSRFTTDEKYAVEQWGDDAVALYPLPVAFIPACFTDERNLKHINERGRETSLIWSKQNSDSGDIKLFRIAAAAGKGE